MDIKHLNYILAIARRKNMTKAAEDLFVSQSSLSQYLSRLEQEIGAPLFRRTKGELIPTPEGVLYLEAAKKVVKIQKDLYRDIELLHKQGNIRVGVTSNFGLRMLSEIIPLFKKEFPKISIEISECSFPALKKMLMEETVDIGLAAALNTVPFEDQSYLLRNEEVFFAVPIHHPYTKRNPGNTLTTEDLFLNFASDNFLLSKRGTSLRELADRLFDACGFTPSAFVETNSIPATRSMIASNTGVAFIAESCSVDRESIKYYSLSPSIYRMNVIFTRKSWNRHEPEDAFISYLQGYFDRNTESPYLAENFTKTVL